MIFMNRRPVMIAEEILCWKLGILIRATELQMEKNL
jgi:hypothetical protein